MKTLIRIFLLMFFLTQAIVGFSQTKVSIAVIGIDTKGMKLDNASMGNLVRLELEKTNQYEVLDKYDVTNLLSKKGIDPDKCFGKIMLIEAGKSLGVQKILTGSVEKFGEKIIFVMRMIDVRTEKIENTNVMEYLNLEDQIQTMAKISVNNIVGIANDNLVVDLLIDYDNLVSSPKTTVRLNGPRMGVSLFLGNTAKRLSASKDEGGYNMYPVSSVFGYQYEFQYLSAGDFQALVETVGAFSGLESGNFIPSLSLMNGFRFNKNGWEFALGPIFRFARMAEGYYDESDKWHLAADMPVGSNYLLENSIDSRGNVKLTTSLIVGFGKTFRSGYLNIPINIYFIPKKEGSAVGINFGFNIAKKQKRQ